MSHAHPLLVMMFAHDLMRCRRNPLYNLKRCELEIFHVLHLPGKRVSRLFEKDDLRDLISPCLERPSQIRTSITWSTAQMFASREFGPRLRLNWDFCALCALDSAARFSAKSSFGSLGRRDASLRPMCPDLIRRLIQLLPDPIHCWPRIHYKTRLPFEQPERNEGKNNASNWIIIGDVKKLSETFTFLRVVWVATWSHSACLLVNWMSQYQHFVLILWGEVQLSNVLLKVFQYFFSNDYYKQAIFRNDGKFQVGSRRFRMFFVLPTLTISSTVSSIQDSTTSMFYFVFWKYLPKPEDIFIRGRPCLRVFCLEPVIICGTQSCVISLFSTSARRTSMKKKERNPAGEHPGPE